jgi:CubicO group peptidase (beta-lactamase class C family)
MKRIFSMFLIVFLLVGCTSATTGPLPKKNSPKTQEKYWPTKKWRTSTPEEQGLHSGNLADMFNYINKTKRPLDSMIVIRHGYIVAEKYRNGQNATMKHPVYSVTKSITSALIGLAIQRGGIKSVDDKVLSFFPRRHFQNVTAEKKSMTIKQLLTMSSGLDWPEISKDERYNASFFNQYLKSKDPVQFVLDRPMLKNGGHPFNYNTGGIHVLSAIVQETMMMSTKDFAQYYLFDPIGIRSNYTWYLDPTGLAYGGSNIEMSPRNMARFGYLYLNNGQWDGKRVIPEQWVKESTTPQIKTNGEYDGNQYGYCFWLKTIKGHKTYKAMGLLGQYIDVIPDLDLVIVQTSRGMNIDDLVEKFIIPSVASSKALPENLKAFHRLKSIKVKDNPGATLP